jgi:hypothetical protein
VGRFDQFALRIEAGTAMNAKTRRALEDLIEPWTGLADDDRAIEEFRNFDSNNKAAVMAVIARDLRPHFEALPEGLRQAAIVALREAESVPPSELEEFLNCLLPPFYPSDYRALFRWIHEALGESPS